MSDASPPSDDPSHRPDDSAPPSSRDTDPEDERPGGLSKRTLIRLLVGFGIGIPILIEAVTFLGLLESQFGNGSDGDTDTDSGSPTTTDDGDDSDVVGIGDDLLPETERTETLASAVLRDSGDTWPLSLTIEVTNTGETDYEFQLLTLHLADGRTIGGRASTGRLTPDESGAVTGEWPIPAGATPQAVDVVALVYDEGAVETIERRVELAKIPVRGN